MLYLGQKITNRVIARSERSAKHEANDAAIHSFKSWIATQNKKRFARNDSDGAITTRGP